MYTHRERGHAARRRLAVGLLCAAVSLVAAHSSAAATAPAPYLDPAYAEAFDAIVTEAAPAEAPGWLEIPDWVSSGSQATRVGAGTAPEISEALALFPYIVVGTTAFAIGYGAGTAIDHVFHISARFGSPATNSGDAEIGTEHFEPWNASERYGNPQGALRLRFASHGEKDYRDSDPTYYQTQALLDAWDQVSRSFPGLSHGDYFGGTGDLHSIRYWISPALLNGVNSPAIVTSVEPYTSQPLSGQIVRGGTVPDLSARVAGAREAMDDTATSNPAATTAYRNYVNWRLDPDNWAAPNADGTGGGPIWTMPSCAGLSVADCESAVIDTAAAAGADPTSFSFSIVTADVTDTAVARELVLSTDPSSATRVHPAVVTMTKNKSDGPDKYCSSTTENPHWSSDTNSMLAKGQITCNYTGAASFRMSMWRCTGLPSEAMLALPNGQEGCSVVATTIEDAPVVPGSPKEVYCPHVTAGAPAVPWQAGYWIATTVLLNGVSSWSQEDWQPAAP